MITEALSGWIPLAMAAMVAGAVAGFVAGLFGIGGGFVVVPALTLALSNVGGTAPDRVMHVAVGTSLATIIATSLRSVQAHARRGAVDFELLRAWAPFVAAGAVGGVLLASRMDGGALRLVFGAGLSVMGGYLCVPRRVRAPEHGATARSLPTGWARAAIALGLGAFSALLGIGGGTPAVLILTFSGVSMHRAVATAAGFGTLIAVPGALCNVIVGWGEPGLPVGSLGFVNGIGLLAIVALSVVTAPRGAALAHRWDPVRLRRVFGAYLLVTSALMLKSRLMPKEAEARFERAGVGAFSARGVVMKKQTERSRRWFLESAAVGGTALLGSCVRGAAAPIGSPNKTPNAPTESVLPPGLFGPTPGTAQLSRNENPYGPGPRVMAAVEEATRKGAYYVSPQYLEKMIAERHGLSSDQVTVSHGSGESLSAAALAWGRTGAILVPDLFWDTTARYAERQGAAIRRVPMGAQLGIDLEAMEAAVEEGVSLVQLCNPNNPTGTLLPPSSLRGFCSRVSQRATVLIDEAYNELTDEPEANSMVDLVRAGRNVMVARTFSKIYGMAGMRIGYMMSTPANIARVKSHQMSWMSAPAVAAAVAAYDDQEFLTHSKAMVLEARQRVVAAVRAAGLTHLPSQTNFLYVNVGRSADEFRDGMERRGVLIRGIYRTYDSWSRVSMGRMEDVQRYVAALPEVVGT